MEKAKITTLKQALALPDNEIPAELLAQVKLVRDARAYVAANKTPYLCERLRDGYIGKQVCTWSGTPYVQTKRGKPYGTIVAIKGDDNYPHYGIYYMPAFTPDGNAESLPIVGLANALKQAKGEIPFVKETQVPSPYKGMQPRKQIEHFLLRAMCYYWPEIYSVSRGSNPVTFKHYEEIHQRQIDILGEEKVKSMACPKNR